jgi:hypothetical protein
MIPNTSSLQVQSFRPAEIREGRGGTIGGVPHSPLVGVFVIGAFAAR